MEHIFLHCYKLVSDRYYCLQNIRRAALVSLCVTMVGVLILSGNVMEMMIVMTDQMKILTNVEVKIIIIYFFLTKHLCYNLFLP